MAQLAPIVYRFTTNLPLQFVFLGEVWRIELAEIQQSGGWWRCTLEGREHWYICEAVDRDALTRMLTQQGVPIRVRCFAETIFQHLARHQFAERVHGERDGDH